MREIYEGLGVANDLTFLELNPDGFDHVCMNGERFDIPKGKERFADRLKERFPGEAKGIDRYLDWVRAQGPIAEYFARAERVLRRRQVVKRAAR